jgi:hypothetical protein
VLLTREPKQVEKKNNAADDRRAERRMRIFDQLTPRCD